MATMGECRFVMLMRMVISTMTVDDHIPPAGPPQRVPPSPHYPPHRISYHRPLRLGQVGVDGIGGRDVGGLGRGIGLYKGYTCIRPLAFGLKPGQLHLLPLGGVYFPTLPPSVPGGVALGGVAGWTGESHSPCACLSRPFSFRRAYLFNFAGIRVFSLLGAGFVPACLRVPAGLGAWLARCGRVGPGPRWRVRRCRVRGAPRLSCGRGLLPAGRGVDRFVSVGLFSGFPCAACRWAAVWCGGRRCRLCPPCVPVAAGAGSWRFVAWSSRAVCVPCLRLVRCGSCVTCARRGRGVGRAFISAPPAAAEVASCCAAISSRCRLGRGPGSSPSRSAWVRGSGRFRL